MRNLCRTVLGVLFAAAPAAAADLEVRSPLIEPEELELDMKFARGFDGKAGRRGATTIIGELEYGATEWWSPALEAEWNRGAGPGESIGFESVTLENRFRLTTPGASWLDAGIYVEYERTSARAAPDVLRAGPMLHAEIGPTSHVLDLFAVRELGGENRQGWRGYYAWQARWPLWRGFEPGLEIYGGPGDDEDRRRFQHRGGPVLFGGLPIGAGHELRYEIGWLLGFNHATPDGTFKLLIGYEMQF